MPTGKMLRWQGERGFGFIQPDDGGPDLFCHVRGFGRFCTKVWQVGSCARLDVFESLGVASVL